MVGKDYHPEPDGHEYQFMRETIKKKPINFRRLLGKCVAVILFGVVFGLCAAWVFTWSAPRFAKYFGEEGGPSEDVKLTESTEAEDGADAETALQADTAGSEEAADTGDVLEEYQQIYERVLEVSENARRALVRVSGTSSHPDLLDDSPLTSGDAEGIVFLKTDSCLYILTDWQTTGKTKTESLQVTFSDDSMARGYLCLEDGRIGLSVIRVHISELPEETRSTVEAAEIDETYELGQTDSVIAIGSPAGDFDGVLYGVVTSVSGRLSVADAEYTLISTNLQGTPEGSGVLLNTAGSIVGVITHAEEDETNIIHALPISELCTVIEQMANKREIRYAGIYGVSISKAQALRLGTEQGIYVENVDEDSPAMEAGIQRGDILIAMDGEAIHDMQSYAEYLQAAEAGAKIRLTISRSSGDGQRGEMELTLTVV